MGTLRNGQLTASLKLSVPPSPRYSAEDLLSIVNPDIRRPFNMLAALLRIVDDSRLSVSKPKYDPNLLTTWAQILGMLSTHLSVSF